MKARLTEEPRECKRMRYSESGGLGESSRALSKYQRASEHIITTRVFKSSWFSRTRVLDSEVEKLSKIVDELLLTYKEYLDTVIKQEPWCETRSLSDFRQITEDVLNADEERYNWTRIAMLLALGTKVGQHFNRKGSTKEFIIQFSKNVGMCIEERVNTWTRKDDRWDALKNDDTKEEEEEESSKNYAHYLGVGAAVASFVATLVNLSMSSTPFMNKIKK